MAMVLIVFALAGIVGLFGGYLCVQHMRQGDEIVIQRGEPRI